MTIENSLIILKEEVDTPALLLDLQVLEENLWNLLEICNKNGVSLRPHAKTHRMAEIGKLQQNLGCDGLCVAKLGEAEGFAAAGIKKITVAYPIIGKSKIKRALELSNSIDLILAVDSFVGAQQIGKMFDDNGKICKVLLIINTGLNRDGVTPDQATAIAVEINSIKGVELYGIMTHEGTVYGSISQKELEEKSIEVAKMMVGIAENIRHTGVNIHLVSMGASASAKFVARVKGVNQIRPGIFAFNDLGQIALGNATPENTAIRVLATVVSRPSENSAIIDAGSKSLSGDLLPAKEFRNEFPGYGFIVGKPGWIIDRLSEEHGILKYIASGVAPDLVIGEEIQIIPNHVCTVFSSLNQCIAIRENHVVGKWRTFPPGASE